MFGSFSEASLSKYVSLTHARLHSDFSESGTLWDFARCVRPDGSAYGVGAGKKCRKGTEKEREQTPVSEPTKRKTREKKPKDLQTRYSALARKAQEAMAAGDVPAALKLNEEAKKLMQKLSEGSKKGDPAAKEKKDRVKKTLANLKRVVNNTDYKLSSDSNGVYMTSVVGDNKVKTMITPKTDGSYEIGYKVNDSYAKGNVTDRREQVRVALTAKRQFDKALESLPEGTRVRAFAYDEDGSGDTRRAAYEKLGFKHQGNNVMTGVVSNGKVQALDFTEGVETAKVWVQILFPIK